MLGVAARPTAVVRVHLASAATLHLEAAAQDLGFLFVSMEKN